MIHSRQFCVLMDPLEVFRVAGCNGGIDNDGRRRDEQVLTQFDVSPRVRRRDETLKAGDCGQPRVLSRNGQIGLNDSRLRAKQTIQPALLIRSTHRVFSTQEFDAALYLEHRAHCDTELLGMKVGEPVQNRRRSPSPAEVRQNVGIEQKDFRQWQTRPAFNVRFNEKENVNGDVRILFNV